MKFNNDILQSYEQTDAQVRACVNIGSLALEIMDARYSNGYPDYRGGRRAKLGLHNGFHSRFVGETALKIAQTLNFSPIDQIIARSVGFTHDLVQLKGVGVNELETSDWYVDHLEGTGKFTVDDVEVGRLAIIGTTPIIKDGLLVSQQASVMEFPSKRHELVAKAVASADLGHLYSPMGPYFAHRFYQELVTGDFSIDPSMDGIRAFQLGQIALLCNYRYPLPEATGLLKTHAAEVINYNEVVLDQIDKGEIKSFTQLLSQDLDFARSNE